jgi:multiple antibiotic resistance protein
MLRIFYVREQCLTRPLASLHPRTYNKGSMPQDVTWPAFVLAFIPLFVAVDPIGLLPVYVALTRGMNRAQRAQVIRQSLATAGGVAVVFVFVGRYIMSVMGITAGDFLIAGGLLLFVLAMIEIVDPKRGVEAMASDVGVVPLGVPFIAGPAVFTTLMLLTTTYGAGPTLIGLALNFVLLVVIFLSADRLMGWLGAGGTKVISKLVALLLAAIGVMLVRRGFEFYGVLQL